MYIVTANWVKCNHNCNVLVYLSCTNHRYGATKLIGLIEFVNPLLLVDKQLVASSTLKHLPYSTYYKPIMYYKPTPLQLKVFAYIWHNYILI